MTRKNIEELNDIDIVELYKIINDFINFLNKEMIGDKNDKWL